MFVVCCLVPKQASDLHPVLVVVLYKTTDVLIAPESRINSL